MSGTDYIKALAFSKLLECQWHKNHIKHIVVPHCESCKDRFICFGIKARKFQLVEDETRWTTYEVYAENEEKAKDMLYDFCGEEDIVPEVDCDGESHGVSVSELPSPNNRGLQ